MAAGARIDTNLARVVIARFVSRSGGEAAFFVGIWGFAAFEFDADPAGLALLMGGLGVSSLIGSALAGVLVDRFDPRRVLIVGEVLFVPAALSITLAGSLLQLTLLASLLGLVGAPVFTAIAAIAPYLTDDEQQLVRANSALEAAGTAAFVVGPALGAVIVRFWSIDWIFVLDAATSLVGAALIMTVKVKALAHREQRGGLAEVREGFRFSYRSRQLRLYVLLGTVAWILYGTFSALEPLYFRDVVGTGPEALGWINALFGLGMVGGATWLSRLPSGFTSARTAVALVALNGLGAVIYAGTSSLVVVATGAAVWGTIIGLFTPMHRTLVHLNSPEGMIGRITGTLQVHVETAHLLPLVIVPALAARFGVQAVMLGAAAVLVLISAAVQGEARAVDRLRTVPVPPPGPLEVADEPISPNP